MAEPTLVFCVHALRRLFERQVSIDDVRRVPESGESPEAQAMRCPICRMAETEPGVATVTLERDDLTLGVPARVCRNCGEEYVEEAEDARLLRDAEDAAHIGVRVDVRDYVDA
jgi:YgiT-type zinc finger domain-containing protein